jgi:tetratricopeptide (TPR) repeat protein
LSIHYYYKGNYDDALWYCEQAIRLTSIDARFWNLRGVVYDRMSEEMEEKNLGEMGAIIDNHRLYSFSIAAVLSWQKLFRSLLRGEDNQRLKNIARVCMSNLAMIHADKGARKSKCLFHQSISVSSGEGKPYYELGRFLFKREDFEEALSAFDKVYEEDSTCADKIVLWTLYLYACEKMIDKKKPGYERKLLCARYHLLNAIYENLWDFDVIPETKIKEISDRIKNSIYKSSKNLKDKDEYEDVEKEFVKLKKLTVEAVGKLFSLLIKEKLEGNKDKLEEEKDKKGKDEFAKNMGANMTKWLIEVMKMEEGESKQEKELKETMLEDMEKLISLLLEDVLKKNVDKSKFKEDELVKKMMKCLGKRILLLNSTERELNPKESKIKEEEKRLAMVQIYIFAARAVKELIEKFRSSEFKFVIDGVNKMLKEGEREIKKLEENHVNKIRMNLLHTFLAWSSIYTNDTRDALFYARKAVAFDPESPEARAALSRVYFKMNNYDLAQKELENCLILNPKAQKILHFIPHIDKWDETLPRDSEKRRKTFDSMAQFLENTLTQMKSRSPEKDDRKGFSDDLRTIYHTLGIFYRNLKKYDEAITRLKVAAALSGSGDVQQTKIDLGWTYLEAGAYNKSEQTFQKLLNKLRLYEDSYKGIEDKGIAIRLGLAISIVERTVLADVDRNSAFYKKPLQLLDEVANQLDKESLKKDYIWYNALYHECQGRIALKQGRTRDATRCMEQSVSIMASPRVYYFLAEAYWMLSQEEKKTKRYLYLEKAREACALSRKCDKNDKYNLEVAELNKRITEALDRIYVPTPAKEEKKSA